MCHILNLINRLCVCIVYLLRKPFVSSDACMDPEMTAELRREFIVNLVMMWLRVFFFLFSLQSKPPPPPPTGFPKVPQAAPSGPGGPPSAPVNMFSRRAGNRHFYG